jgi:hypothetical protein
MRQGGTPPGRGRDGSEYSISWNRRTISLNFVLCRMATSKLFVDPAHLAKAEKDDWATCAFLVASRTLSKLTSDVTLSAFAKIENHYFINKVRVHNVILAASEVYSSKPRDSCAKGSSWRNRRSTRCMPQPFRAGDVLEDRTLTLTCDHDSRHIPCVVVQGRYDVVCPVGFPRSPYLFVLFLQGDRSNHR